MAESVGLKRTHSEIESGLQQYKRRKVRRTLRHVQSRPQHVEPAPQDPVFVQGQLLRSITAALTMVGFDSVKPTALEMFRASVEEYMLGFLHNARTSMHTNRRTSPTALDFTSALARTPNTSTASLLKPHVKLALPADISTPDILGPEVPPPAAPDDFSALLQPLVTDATPIYIPPHFPRLPPQHAWKHTPVFPEREQDARRMRERATEEGILAEQALRKLAAAAKSGAVKAEKRRESSALSGHGRRRETNHDRRKVRPGGGEDEGMFAAMLQEAGGGGSDEAAAMEMSLDGAAELREEGVDVGMPEGVVVNWDMRGWRHGGQKGRTRA